MIHSEKKGTETVPLGYYCYKKYPFFRGALFFSLIIMFIRKRVPLSKRVLFSKRVPLGALFCKKKKGSKRCPFMKKGYYFGTPRGTVFTQKKVKNSTPLKKRGTLWKTVPFLQRWHYFSIPGILFWTKRTFFTKGYCLWPFFLRKNSTLHGEGYYFFFNFLHTCCLCHFFVSVKIVCHSANMGASLWNPWI